MIYEKVRPIIVLHVPIWDLVDIIVGYLLNAIAKIDRDFTAPYSVTYSIYFGDQTILSFQSNSWQFNCSSNIEFISLKPSSLRPDDFHNSYILDICWESNLDFTDKDLRDYQELFKQLFCDFLGHSSFEVSNDFFLVQMCQNNLLFDDNWHCIESNDDIHTDDEFNDNSSIYFVSLKFHTTRGSFEIWIFNNGDCPFTSSIIYKDKKCTFRF